MEERAEELCTKLRHRGAGLEKEPVETGGQAGNLRGAEFQAANTLHGGR